MQGEQEQNYDTSVTSDAAHGKPVTAPFGNGQSAISLILASDGAATVPSYCSGSLNFASQVAFHTLGGLQFVTYTIDAQQKVRAVKTLRGNLSPFLLTRGIICKSVDSGGVETVVCWFVGFFITTI
jgi:hypothetical protein